MYRHINGLTRRSLLTTSAALALSSTLPAASHAQSVAGLPARGEFVIRGAAILTMDPTLGDIAKGDIHVRNGVIAAVGSDIIAPGVEIIELRQI